MKKITSILIITFFPALLLAQDIIVKQNGEEIQSKVLEITSETIKYKEFEFQNGPTRNINISEVFMIIYENGKREKFTLSKNKQSNNSFKGKYFMLGLGYGNSYGGTGLRAQWRMGENQGLGFHAGVGYFSNAPILVSAGVKFFPYKDLYINAQFGSTGYEYTHYDDEYRSYVLYGPSLLIGGDWTWGGKVGYGFNAGLGFTYNMNVQYFAAITLALDAGFIIRF